MKRLAALSVATLLVLLGAAALLSGAGSRQGRPGGQMVSIRSLYGCVSHLVASDRRKGAVHEPVVVAPKFFSPGLQDEREFSATVYSNQPDKTTQAWFYVVTRRKSIPAARQFYVRADMDKLVVFAHQNVIVVSDWPWTRAQYALVHSCLRT